MFQVLYLDRLVEVIETESNDSVYCQFGVIGIAGFESPKPRQFIAEFTSSKEAIAFVIDNAVIEEKIMYVSNELFCEWINEHQPEFKDGNPLDLDGTFKDCWIDAGRYMVGLTVAGGCYSDKEYTFEYEPTTLPPPYEYDQPPEAEDNFPTLDDEPTEPAIAFVIDNAVIDSNFVRAQSKWISLDIADPEKQEIVFVIDNAGNDNEAH